MRWIFALIITLLSSSTTFADPNVATPHLYGVVFEVTTDPAGKVDTLKVSKVMDPATGTTDPISLGVPNSYIGAARKWLGQRTYKPSDHFFTWTYFDPQAGRP